MGKSEEVERCNLASEGRVMSLHLKQLSWGRIRSLVLDYSGAQTKISGRTLERGKF